MNKIIGSIISLCMLVGLGSISFAERWQSRFYDLNRNQTIDSKQFVGALKDKRIVLVGEHHTNVSHHQAQLTIMHMLNEIGLKITVGLEMFRSDSRAVLERWIAGKIDPGAFEQQYYDNWNYPWSLYRDIFEYAREKKSPCLD